MSLLLDIFGSVVIAGMLFMMIVKLNLFSNQTSYTSDNELKLIQNTKTLAEIMDYDFRKVGYRVSGNAIEIAKEKQFKFKADMDRDTLTTPNTIEYTVSTTSKVMGTENPNDIILYRILDSDSMGGPSLGLVDIKFTYLDSAFTALLAPVSSADLSKIRYIRTQIWTESDYSVKEAFSNDSSYSRTYWEFTINPRNL